MVQRLVRHFLKQTLPKGLFLCSRKYTILKANQNFRELLEFYQNLSAFTISRAGQISLSNSLVITYDMIKNMTQLQN